MLSTHASAKELIANGDAVGHVNGKGDGPTLLAVLMPMLDDVADQPSVFILLASCEMT
jgi:hypothetical protein